MEMSSVMSMLPYHTVTASAVLTSMLSVAPRTHAWTLEGDSHFCQFNVLCLNTNKLFCELLSALGCHVHGFFVHLTSN